MTIGGTHGSRLLRIGLCMAATMAALLYAASSAFAVSDRVKEACKSDYYQHCSQYSVGTEELRKCMRQVGDGLSAPCLVALVDDGEITKADIDNHNARKSGVTKAPASPSAEKTEERKKKVTKPSGSGVASAEKKGKGKAAKANKAAGTVAGKSGTAGKTASRSGKTTKSAATKKVAKSGIESTVAAKKTNAAIGKKNSTVKAKKGPAAGQLATVKTSAKSEKSTKPPSAKKAKKSAESQAP